MPAKDLDDILLHSKTLEEAFQRLIDVLEYLGKLVYPSE